MAVIKHSESAGIERTGHFTSYVKKKRMRRHSANSSGERLEGNHDVEAVIDNKNFNPGSAGSLAKSMNGSLRSELSGHGCDVDGDNINVVIRVRPISTKESKANDESIIQFPGEGQIWVDESKANLKPFTFNVVFEPEATQEDVLEHSGMKRLIEMGIDGFSTTVFCYGQTGSGKTHTLTGPPYLEKILTNDHEKKGKEKQMVGRTAMNKDHGLVFRSFIYLFEQLEARKDDATFVIKASYLEIYNEKVIDLLNPGAKRSNLAVRWNKRSRAFVVDNLFSIECGELDDLLAVLEEGLKNRAIGTHNMNEHSSRSHTILTVHIHSEEKASSDDNKGVFITRHGKINFVDLAGSEMTKKTKSEGKTLEEANNINKSLMVLGYCIAQLSTTKKSDKGVHIPYRDSKLTKLLADSLAGNGVTLMIACVSPARSNLSESSNTLRYAARAKRIKTKPVVVMDPREALIVALKREVGILQQENNHLRQLVELADNSAGDTVSQGFPADMKQLVVAGVGGGTFDPPSDGRATPATKKKIDKQRLNELDSSTLVELIKDYMHENSDLRRENTDLFSVRDMMLRDQELVCRENERLLKKLEDVNSVCCRSPIIPARPSYSAELMSLSYSGSLPRSSGTSGSAPDLTSEYRHAGGSSPVTDLWTNPLHEGTANGTVSRVALYS
eukprot:TRINITY_DN12478_c0_g1_i1.p1 TRINITY_DN12478_c0_g1~~TRINITY_DN12478_c0_g1_i1.p1  ORF type:complete len:672 (-),score=126.88 TRINITY_DN12478_c0_g1_i1:947-2962(-)